MSLIRLSSTFNQNKSYCRGKKTNREVPIWREKFGLRMYFM